MKSTMSFKVFLTTGQVIYRCLTYCLIDFYGKNRYGQSDSAPMDSKCQGLKFEKA